MRFNDCSLEGSQQIIGGILLSERIFRILHTVTRVDKMEGYFASRTRIIPEQREETVGSRINRRKRKGGKTILWPINWDRFWYERRWYSRKYRRFPVFSRWRSRKREPLSGFFVARFLSLPLSPLLPGILRC